MTNYYWCYRGDQRGAPYHLELTRAETPALACAAFAEPFPSPCVHDLTSPRLQRLADGVAPGLVGLAQVDQLPLASAWTTERGYS